MFRRQLVSKMIEMEVKHSGSAIQENFSNIVKIGELNVTTPDRQFTLDLMVSKCESESPFSLLEFSDQTVAVCLDLKGFDLFFSPSMKDLPLELRQDVTWCETYSTEKVDNCGLCIPCKKMAMCTITHQRYSNLESKLLNPEV